MALNWNDITGGWAEGREAIAQRTVAKLDAESQARARLEECADEHTGRRYGDRRCRRGRAVKLGGGGRNKGSRYAYQVWLVWA